MPFEPGRTPEAPKETEQIVDSLTNIDTARMTVRWALERIRFLEQANNEMLELLRGAREAKDLALKDLGEARQSADKRLSAITQKERFVTEMQGMLNGLFKGQIDLKEVIEAKTQLEQHKAELEAQAKARIQDAEAKARKQEDDFQKRLTEMEANYAHALGDAERRYQEQLQDFQRQRHEESLEVSAREARFKEKLIEEAQKQADQYHQKLSLLQFEFSAKRQDVQKEFDELKEKLFQEARHVEMRQADTFRLAKEHWDAERKRLEDLLAQREVELGKQHESLKATSERLKQEAAQEVAHREEELRALEARLRQELAAELAKREAELAVFEERVRSEAEEARERDEQVRRRELQHAEEARARDEERAAEAARRVEEERKKPRDELAALQNAFDSRVALAVQEQLRVREEELNKRLDSCERQETDFQVRLQRATEQLQERIAQIEARSAAELEAARAESARLVQDQVARDRAALEATREEDRRVMEAHASREMAAVENARAEGRRVLEEQASRQFAEVQTARTESTRMLEEQAKRHLTELQAIREQARTSEARLQEALQKEREAALKAVEEQTRRDRETFDAIEMELRRELATSHADIQAINEAHAQEAEHGIEARHQLRQTFESQLAAEFSSHEGAKKAMEEHLAQREAQWLAERQKREAELEAQAAARTRQIEAEFQARLRALQEDNQRLAAQRAQEAVDAAARLKELQTRFDEKLAADLRGRLELAQKQWAIEKAALELKVQAEKTSVEQRLLGERAALEKRAQEVIAAAEGRWREAVATAQAKADALTKQTAELGVRADETERTLARSRSAFPWKRAALCALAVVAAAGTGTGGWFYANRGRDYKIPFSHPSGLAWQGETLWAADWHDQAVYELAPGKSGLVVRQRHALPGVAAAGLALGRDKLFVIDGATFQLQRYSLDKDLTLIGTVSSPGPQPSALFHDGHYLWSADKQTGLLYQHADDETLSVLQTFPLGPDTAGLQLRDAELWWAGSQNKLFSRLGAPPGLSKLDVFSLPELDGTKKPISCFAWKDGKLWVGLEGEQRLLQRPRWRLAKR